MISVLPNYTNLKLEASASSGRAGLRFWAFCCLVFSCWAFSPGFSFLDPCFGRFVPGCFLFLAFGSWALRLLKE